MGYEPYIGQIMLFAGNFPPQGYMLCNGQTLSIAQYSALYAVLGTTYGGDGSNTFNLPNLMGRTPISSGQGPNLSYIELGQAAGEESVTLMSTQMAMHNHVLNVSTDAATSSAVANQVLAVESTGGTPIYTATPDTAMNPQAIGLAGGSQPHNNIQPSLVMNYCIAIEGLYPPHN